MRIASLLPSATEIVSALGLQGSLVARSHSCCFPPGIEALPVVTSCDINPALSSTEIDAGVRASRASGASLYGILGPELQALAPDLVVSQGVCDVCAVSGALIDDVLSGFDPVPRLINLEPFSLSDILETVRQVGAAAGVPDRAEALLADWQLRIAAVRQAAANLPKPRTIVVDWIDPPFLSGHWTHDLLEVAGAENIMSNKGQPSVKASWPEIEAAKPDLLVVACCGFEEDRTLAELAGAPEAQAALNRLRAAGTRVEITDGHGHFSNPGPRIIDSLERLAAMVSAARPHALAGE